MKYKRVNAAIRRDSALEYPMSNPFDPSIHYPEYEGTVYSEEKNLVYDAFRYCLLDMEMDKEKIGTSKWSPFSEFISPGNTVVIKPNFVLMSDNIALQNSITTHPSLIRAVIDYCWKALDGKGRIIVGDACSSEADFERLVQETGTKEMIERLQARGVAVELVDFRAIKVTVSNGIWTGEQSKTQESEKGQLVSLGTESLFYDSFFEKKILHGAGYDIAQTNQHHHGSVQEYFVSKKILHADVVISIPKVKTHRKAGFTCCLKNLVGINADKNYLPHFSMGSKNMGGDEMPEIGAINTAMLRMYNFVRKHIISHTWKLIGKPGAKFLGFLKNCSKAKSEDISIKIDSQDASQEDLAHWLHSKLSGQNVAAGAWAGNYTICCMILDLNRIFLCCDRNGKLCSHTDRKIFYVADGIWAGMGDGPTNPIPCHLGAIAVGYNGLKIDKTLLKLFGVNPDAIPLYKKAEQLSYMHLNEEGQIEYNGQNYVAEDRFGIELIPPSNWSY